jgi:hypothetical protein
MSMSMLVLVLVSASAVGVAVAVAVGVAVGVAATACERADCERAARRIARETRMARIAAVNIRYQISRV